MRSPPNELIQHSLSDDAKLLATLDAAGQGGLPERLGGLDAEINWRSTLSLAEQQAVVLAGVLLARPQFAVLDRLSTTVGVESAAAILKRLKDGRIGCMAFEGTAEGMAEAGALVELQSDGSWRARSSA